VAKSFTMGRLRGGGSGLIVAAMAATSLLAGVLVLPGQAVASSNETTVASLPAPSVSGPATAAATTLPALPQVSPTYTDGQTPSALLSNAITLSSLGTDNSVLIEAVAVTQAKLDADEHLAEKARAGFTAAATAAAAARARAASAEADYSKMAGAIRQAVLYLYTSGPDGLTISPMAGPAAIYAQDYAESTIGAYGVLARRQSVEQERAQALRAAGDDARRAAGAAAASVKALADEHKELGQLKSELASAAGASAPAVEVDHMSLASQAGSELLSESGLQFTPKTPIPAPVSTTSVALTWAFAQLGKEYVWGATGPDTFDCSGLTQFAWKAAGVSIPRVAADQDSWTIPVPLSELLPGDLVFFGTTDIHHVGIYIGDGLMINAPHTGTVVQVSSIWWSDLAGFGRVHSPGAPVPPHSAPTITKPAVAVVIASAGPVPSQPKPPAGWRPAPDSTTPIRLSDPAGNTTAPVSESTTTSSTTNTGSVSSTTLSPEGAGEPTTTISTTTAAPTTTSPTTEAPAGAAGTAGPSSS
jgi:cell wall-associated NlpC family hydrolase